MPARKETIMPRTDRALSGVAPLLTRGSIGASSATVRPA